MESEEFYAEAKSVLAQENDELVIDFNNKAHNRYISTERGHKLKGHWKKMRDLSTEVLEERELSVQELL